MPQYLQSVDPLMDTGWLSKNFPTGSIAIGDRAVLTRLFYWNGIRHYAEVVHKQEFSMLGLRC